MAGRKEGWKERREGGRAGRRDRGKEEEKEKEQQRFGDTKMLK